MPLPAATRYFVIEADEYDHMFLGLNPDRRRHHQRRMGSPGLLSDSCQLPPAFMQFIDSVDRRGLVISCRDDEGAEQLRAYGYYRAARTGSPMASMPTADLRAVNLDAIPGQGIERRHPAVVACQRAVACCKCPALHNVRNALAAVAGRRSVTSPWPTRCDAPRRAIAASARRFEWKGEAGGVIVIDDYAHHPTEIQATLAAARQRLSRPAHLGGLSAAHLQPHAHHALPDGESFGQADEVIVIDIYAAREADDGSVSAAELVAASPHPAIRHIGGLAESGALLGERCAARRCGDYPGRRRRLSGRRAAAGAAQDSRVEHASGNRRS